MSKSAKNISDTLNSTLLVIHIQLVKHSTIIDSAVVSLAFHSFASVAPFAILLSFNNWKLEQT